MFDLIIRGGRTIDPETARDEICDVAIKDGLIVAVGDVGGSAERTIEAGGLIVTAGFVDLHGHGQSVPADRMQAFDGVTTSLELEIGVLPVARWYDEQAEAGRVLNYGASAGWIFGRIAAMTAQQTESTIEGMGLATRDSRWVTEVADGSETADIVERVRTGLEQGALGIGFPNAYAPGTGLKEISQLCSVAAGFGTPTFTHIAFMSNVDPLSSIEGYTRLIGLAGSTGAHMHICHFNSTSLLDVERAAELVTNAQNQGLKVTLEAYPYGTGATVVSADFFGDPAFPKRFGMGYDKIEDLTSRHRFRDREDLFRARDENAGSLVLVHFLDVAGNDRHRDLLDVSVLFPGGAIASDALPWTMANGTTYVGDVWPLPEEAVSHPRSSGTFTKFLKEWVRERRTIALPEALRKCSLIPAQLLESCTPAMRRKGRLQVGCDADIVAFDYETLTDRADFYRMNAPSEGVRHLLIGGQSVISNGSLVLEARPGRPVRRPVA